MEGGKRRRERRRQRGVEKVKEVDTYHEAKIGVCFFFQAEDGIRDVRT